MNASQLLTDPALLELMPTTVYVINTEDYIKGYNQRACPIGRRTPRINEHTDEKWCRAYKLLLPNGTHMPHD